MSTLRNLFALFGFGGALIFGGAFVASFARPTLVEDVAHGIIRREVEERMDAAVSRVEENGLVRLADRLRGGNGGEIEGLQRLRDGLSARVASVSAEMRDPACACRQVDAAALTGPITSLEAANARLTMLVRARYLDAVAELTRELRIFAAANALVLLLLGLAAVKHRSARLLLPAAAILAVSAAGTGYVYLFRQDWMRAILFGDYVGLAYFAYLAAPAFFLGDLLLNRGRVTARLLGVGMAAAGTVVSSATPC